LLLVHGGLRRTGTSSLQAVLAAHRAELTAVGVDYPDRWRPGGADAHHGLAELLEPGEGRDAALDSFRLYLEGRAGGSVLLSSEVLSTWLSEDRRPSLLGLLRRAGEATRLCCAWTLRPADEILTSMYLHQVMFGYEVPGPEEYFLTGLPRVTEAIVGLGELERALDGESIYMEYDPAGAHNEEILSRAGVADPTRGQLMEALRESPRLNPRLTHKAAAAMLHRDAISVQMGVEVTSPALKGLFYEDGPHFAGDGPCVVVGDELRRAAHNEALSAAREIGFAPYLEFFGDHKIEAAPPEIPGPDALNGEDLERLAEQLHG
jgi:hypothetical protein